MTQELLDAINFTSSKGDRFLFIGLLFLGIIAASIVFKYLTSRLDKVEQKMDQVQQDFNSHLKVANREMMEVLNVSNQAIGKNMLILDRIERRLEKL